MQRDNYRKALRETDFGIVNLDILTYAGNPESLACIQSNARYRFVRGDIGNRTLVAQLLKEFAPTAIVKSSFFGTTYILSVATQHPRLFRSNLNSRKSG